MSTIWQQVLITLISVIFTAIVSALITKITVSKKKLHDNEEYEKKQFSAVEKGVMLLLRSDLIRLHDEFIAKGYCPIGTKLYIEEEYECYHELGGDGVITTWVEDIKRLPEHA